MKNIQLRKFSLLVFFSIILISFSCKKSSTSTDTVAIPDVITTGAIIDLTSTGAQSGGSITSAGNGIITANGVCYSATNKTPTTADTKTTDAISNAGTSTTTFTSNLTGLTPNTLYYLRAYATNSAGTGYGATIQFTTSSDVSSIAGVVTTYAGSATPGAADGTGTGAQFNNPQGITVDATGNIYVADTYNNTIRKITSGAAVATFAGNGVNGYVNGPAATAEFYSPQGIVTDAAGNVYVADMGNNVIRKITTNGVVSLYAGMPGIAGYRNGEADSTYLNSSKDTLSLFNSPQGLAIDAAGNIYVADRGNNVIRKISPKGRVITIAGAKNAGYVNATDESAYFNSPTGVCVDASGNVYVADAGNSAIRKITPGGVVTTIAGGPAQANLLNSAVAIAIDASGNFYITDQSGRILKYSVSTTTNVLYVLAGTSNVSGFTDGTGGAAQFSNPQGIALDATGNIYVADQYNNAIRKIVVSTVTGSSIKNLALKAKK